MTELEARRAKASAAVTVALTHMRAGENVAADRALIGVVHSGVWPRVRPSDVIVEAIEQTGGTL